MKHRSSVMHSSWGIPPWLRRLGFGCLLLSLPLVAGAQSREYRVKAAFLFNFAKFVEWPPETLPDKVPLRIGIWAPEAPFVVMADALSGKAVGRHTLAVYRYTSESDPPHILFVHEESEPIPSEQLRRLALAHVLVVGESSGFAARYGIIGLVPRGDTLGFEVNVGAAKRAQLTLSGQLARLAEIVRDKP